MIDELIRVRNGDACAETRQPGFYWVRKLGEANAQPARWSGTGWFFVGEQKAFTDDDLAAVSGKRIAYPISHVA